jgi:hypothetical protein
MKYPYIIGHVISLIAFLLIFNSGAAAQSLKVEPAGISPAADLVLSIDDGTAEDGIGGTGAPGFGWFNILTPDTYPATLKEVQVAFNNSARGVQAGSPMRVVVFLDLEGDGPNNGQRAESIVSVTVNNPGSFERYTLPKALTIESGSFVVGVIDSIFVAELPALIDQPGTITPAGSKSFFTLDNGQTFGRVDLNFPGFGIPAGSWLVRAVVEVATPPPVIKRAFYRNNKLRIFGRNFTKDAIIRINGKKINRTVTFDGKEGKLVIKGSPEQLNLNPAGQSNKLVVVVEGVASVVFEFTS